MPFVRVAISSVSVSMEPFISAMAVSESFRAWSVSFFLSSYLSSELVQYAFLASSSTCSFLRFATMASVMAIILSRPIFFPVSANAIRSISGRCGKSLWCVAARCTLARARALRAAVVSVICMKLASAPGSVFLNKSSASSLLRSLIVSARATSSSCRVFWISAHSLFFFPHPSPSSSRNLLSSPNDCCVSSRSFSLLAILRASMPRRPCCFSICAWSVSDSLVFAAISASYVFTESASVADESSRSFCISSFICLRMPRICPLWGV
mmetsp:Transcript_98424/g.195187  ORF Transcript_98424/g.195187 Transcript_98424/m.195187 type:complete len:267 (+) Transcript_98424:682-1482(+)